MTSPNTHLPHLQDCKSYSHCESGRPQGQDSSFSLDITESGGGSDLNDSALQDASDGVAAGPDNQLHIRSRHDADYDAPAGRGGEKGPAPIQDPGPLPDFMRRTG